MTKAGRIEKELDELKDSIGAAKDLTQIKKDISDLNAVFCSLKDKIDKLDKRVKALEEK